MLDYKSNIRTFNLSAAASCAIFSIHEVKGVAKKQVETENRGKI